MGGFIKCKFQSENIDLELGQMAALLRQSDHGHGRQWHASSHAERGLLVDHLGRSQRGQEASKINESALNGDSLQSMLKGTQQLGRLVPCALMLNGKSGQL